MFVVDLLLYLLVFGIVIVEELDDVFGLCCVFESGLVRVVVSWMFDVVICVDLWVWYEVVLLVGFEEYWCFDMLLYLVIVEVVGIFLFVVLVVENRVDVNVWFDMFLFMFCNI